MPAMPPLDNLLDELEPVPAFEPGVEEEDAVEVEVLVGRVAGRAMTWADVVSSKMHWETLNVREL